MNYFPFTSMYEETFGESAKKKKRDSLEIVIELFFF